MTVEWQVVHQVLSNQADVGRVVPVNRNNAITLTPSVHLIDNMSVVAHANYDNATTIANEDGRVCLSTADPDSATRPHRGHIEVIVNTEIDDENFSNNAMDYAYEWDMKFYNMNNIGDPQYIQVGRYSSALRSSYYYTFIQGTTNHLRLYKHWRNGKLCAMIHTNNDSKGVVLDLDYSKWHKCKLVPIRISSSQVYMAFSIDDVFVANEIGRYRYMYETSFVLQAVGLMNSLEGNFLNPFVTVSNFKVLFKRES